MKTNTPFNIIFLKIICSTFKSQTNSIVFKKIVFENKKYIFNIFFIEKKCSNFKINRLQKLNFLDNSRKFLMAVLGHHSAVTAEKCTKKCDARAKLLFANKTCCLFDVLTAVAVVVAKASSV